MTRDEMNARFHGLSFDQAADAIRRMGDALRLLEQQHPEAIEALRVADAKQGFIGRLGRRLFGPPPYRRVP